MPSYIRRFAMQGWGKIWNCYSLARGTAKALKFLGKTHCHSHSGCALERQTSKDCNSCVFHAVLEHSSAYCSAYLASLMIYKLYKNSKRVSSPSMDSVTINLNNSDWVIQTLLLRKNLEIETVSKFRWWCFC